MDKTQWNYGNSSIVQNMDTHVVRYTGLFLKGLFYLFCLSQFSNPQHKIGRAQPNLKHSHTFQPNSPVTYSIQNHSRVQIQEWNTLDYAFQVELYKHMLSRLSQKWKRKFHFANISFLLFEVKLL